MKPSHVHRSLEAWRAAEAVLTEHNAELDDPLRPSPANIARLRNAAPTEVVAKALELAAARHRGAEKFAHAKHLWLDREGLEQASSDPVAAYKARRFARALAARPDESIPVVDLCCGIGGDAMALAKAAPRLLVVDSDSQRAVAARHNVAVAGGMATAVLGDAAEVLASGGLLHLDPARRIESRGGGRQRLWRYADHRPGPDAIERLVASSLGAAVKLGPGLDVESLPVHADRELEWIAHGRTLRQAVWWSGALVRHPGLHTATDLDAGCSVHGAPTPLSIDTVPPNWFEGATTRYLWVPHPAVERARLVESLVADRECLELAPGLGVLSASVAATDVITNGAVWCPSFLVRAELPWRQDRVKAWLANHGAGEVTVRTRGGAVDANQAARALRGNGDRPYVVFVFRIGPKRLRAFVTEAAAAMRST